ncbi:MAG: hypothetical protein ACQETK_04250 [Pseudomonadota bacterium]
MLDGMRLILALGLPWLAAAVLLLNWWPREAPGRWAGVLGVGYFLAMFAVAGLLLGLDRLLGGWYPAAILVLAGLLALAGAWLARGGVRTPAARQPAGGALTAGWADAAWWVRVGVLVLLALIVVRMGGWLVEILWRPVYGWDAYYYWSYRARGFLEHGGADAFIRPRELLRGEGEGYGQYYRHPPLVSVIQMWPALALGRWHESLVNLPWFLAGAALGLAIYGYLRRLRLGILPATLAAYMTLSVPLLGVHVGLGGYADIWMTGTFGIAALALFTLFRELRWQEWLVLLPLVLAIPFIKQAGILFAAPFLLAVLLAWLRPWWGIALVVLLAAVGVGVALLAHVEVHLPILGPVVLDAGRVVLPHGGEFAFEPHWGMLFRRLFLDGSWHLLFVLGSALLVLAVHQAWRQPAHRAVWVLMMAIAVMTLVAYGGTQQAGRMLDGTGFGRHVLPLAPVIVAWFWLWLGDRLADPRSLVPARNPGPLTSGGGHFD